MDNSIQAGDFVRIFEHENEDFDGLFGHVFDRDAEGFYSVDTVGGPRVSCLREELKREDRP